MEIALVLTAMVLVVAAMCIVCFMVGAKVGQAVSKGEDIQTPTINPLKAYREHEQRKEAEKEQNRMETAPCYGEDYTLRQNVSMEKRLQQKAELQGKIGYID